jgi:predicted RNA binding protein YcfA (HicA-like mRNA interferase family)
MPARAEDLERVAKRLGFVRARQRGSHARWKHSDGRSTTIPVHPSVEIGGWLFHEILKQLEISEEEFHRLNQ